MERAQSTPFLDNVVNTLGAIKERLLELGEIFKSGFWEGMGNYKPVLDELKKGPAEYRRISGRHFYRF